MHPSVIFIGLLCLALALFVFVFLSLRRRAQRKARIKSAFGRPPQRPLGLAVAEDFLAAHSKAHPEVPLVDDLTFSDLDGDTVFYRINACHSAAGDVRLYHALRHPETDPAAPDGPLARRQALMALFEDETVRMKAQLCLAALGRADGAGMEMTVFRTDTMQLKHTWVFRILSFFPLLSIPLFLFLGPVPGLVGLAVAAWVNFTVHITMKDRNGGGFRWVRYLASAIHCAGKLARELRHQAPQLAGQLRQAIRQLRVLRGSIAVLNFNHVMDEAALDPLALLLLPLLSYGRLAKRLAGKQPQAQALYELLGEIDLAICLLSFRQSLPHWCTPSYLEENRLECEGLYHPLVQNAVPNSAIFAQSMLFTGSNASGKSTFIKAVALNCLFAQSLCTCTATRFALRPGAVATSMAVADSVVDGDSYFVAEIKSMRRLVRSAPPAGSPAFAWFFIDEILKGTNTVERVAAAAAVLARLQKANCLCFAATHDGELCRILEGLYGNVHFQETVTDGGVVFDYTLRPGPATSRNAILLLEKMDFPAGTVAAAQAMVAHFEQTGEWQSINEAADP